MFCSWEIESFLYTVLLALILSSVYFFVFYCVYSLHNLYVVADSLPKVIKTFTKLPIIWGICLLKQRNNMNAIQQKNLGLKSEKT